MSTQQPSRLHPKIIFQNGKLLSPGGATTRSPTTDKDSTKSSKAGDDSGYQDTDEQILHKQNRELMTKILELQNQVDCMKIQMCEIPEAKPLKFSTSVGSTKKIKDYAAVATTAGPLLGEVAKVTELSETQPARPYSDNTTSMSISTRPLHREFAQVEISEEQIKCNESIEGESGDLTKQVSFPPHHHVVSDERVRELGKVLSIEILGNPKEDKRTRNWDDTRAKTKEDADGTLHITEEASSDKFSPFDLMNDDYRKYNETDSPKVKIREKKKLEIPGSSKLGSANVSLKSAMSDVAPGFNPEKLKYLEAEGIITKPKFEEGMSKFKEDTVSLTESVPSNPELGFGIPRLASKSSQDKNKAQADFGHAKISPSAGNSSQRQARDDLMKVLHGKLKLPMTADALLANRPTAPEQTDDTKKKEDCENCAACSFDKECELKHKIATNNRMSTLALGTQKEQAKKHDQHNSLQIPGPIQTSDSNKREKMRNLFSRFLKDRSTKVKNGDFIINQKISGQQTTATTDRPANLSDVPLSDKKEQGTDSIKIDKKILTYDKTDNCAAQKKGSLTEEDLIVKSKISAKKSCVTTNEPISSPDVPLIDKAEDSKDTVERKPSRIVFSLNNNLDPPLLEVKMPTYRPHSERMLPTLLAPTNWRDSADLKADVAQSIGVKLAEKSSQVPTNIAPPRKRDMSLYRRRSGTLRYRAAPPGPAPPACLCAARLDGYCSDKPRAKGIQAHDKEEVKSPRDQQRQPLTSERGTYTVNSKQTDTSPENTDLEMSNLSDLPMEKENKSVLKSGPLSPGEDRTTTFTNKQKFYSPPSSFLSEGEMPISISKRKLSEPGIDMPYLNAALPHKLETPPSQQMEAALQAISEELQRCRVMLRAHRPPEPKDVHCWT